MKTPESDGIESGARRDSDAAADDDDNVDDHHDDDDEDDGGKRQGWETESEREYGEQGKVDQRQIIRDSSWI